jgi:hypothetical protein
MRFAELGPASMCETVPETGWSPWEYYAKNKSWTVSNTYGNKKMCVQFYNANGTSICSGMIKYKEGKPVGSGGGGGGNEDNDGGGSGTGSSDSAPFYYAGKHLFQDNTCSKYGTYDGNRIYYSSYELCQSAIAPIESTQGMSFGGIAIGKCQNYASGKSYRWYCYACKLGNIGGECTK